MVDGFGDQYRISVQHSNDPRLLHIVRSTEPVRVDRDEWEWWTTNIVLEARESYPNWRWRGPDAPRTKPALAAVFIDPQDRIWVLREGKGLAISGCAAGSHDLGERLRSPCWQRSFEFDIYDADDGRLLTTVAYPGMLSRQVMPAWDGEHVFLPEVGLDGNTSVSKYRLVAAPR
jgi:hypothetical protein